MKQWNMEMLHGSKLFACVLWLKTVATQQLTVLAPCKYSYHRRHIKYSIMRRSFNNSNLRIFKKFAVNCQSWLGIGILDLNFQIYCVIASKRLYGSIPKFANEREELMQETQHINQWGTQEPNIPQKIVIFRHTIKKFYS